MEANIHTLLGFLSHRVNRSARKFMEGLSITVHDICLLLSSCKPLENWRTLAYYNITEESNLDVSLYENLNNFRTIFVTCLSEESRKFTVFVSNTDSIEDVKVRIQDREGIPIKEQLLLYAGRELKDECKLSEFNIQKDSTIHLVRRISAKSGTEQEHTDDDTKQTNECESTFFRLSLRPHYGTESMSISIEVRSTDTIKKIKAQAVKVIPVDLLLPPDQVIAD